MNNLLSQKCVPCEGGVLPLTKKEIQRFLPQVPWWVVVEDEKIQKDFKFRDFKGAMAFVNKVAELAEQENHHPDILIHGYRKVRLELYTHAIGGLSKNDFILAAKINALGVPGSESSAVPPLAGT